LILLDPTHVAIKLQNQTLKKLQNQKFGSYYITKQQFINTLPNKDLLHGWAWNNELGQN
jgi:hypothetical protein